MLKQITILAIIVITSCVDSSPFFGNELIPPNQKVKSASDSTIRINTYITKQDSLRTSNISNITYAGVHYDNQVGSTIAQFTTNYYPEGFDAKENFFGKNEPRIDSMKLIMDISYFSGDTTSGAMCEIFKVTKFNFNVDSLYYNTFPIEQYVDPTPIMSFEVKESKIYIETLPLTFAKEYLDTSPSEDNVYDNDDKFHEKYNGLYFKFTPQSSDVTKTVMYRVNLNSSSMSLYYNNKDYPSHPDTTLTQQFSFYDVDKEGLNTTNIQVYNHDYSSANQSQGGIDPITINDTLTPTSKGYITTMAGLGVKIELNKSDYDGFIQTQKDIFGDNVGIGIHSAMLEFSIADHTWEYMNENLNSLGLYRQLFPLVTISDYRPDEDNRRENQLQPQPPVSTLGGVLNRTKGKYVMNITSYFQQLVSSTDVKDDNLTLKVFPLFNTNIIPSQTTIWGGAVSDDSLKPQLTIVYTIFK